MFIKPEERITVEPTREQKPLKLSEAVREAGYADFMHYDNCVLGRAYRLLTGRSLADDGRLGGPHPHCSYYRCSAIAAEAFGVPLAAAKHAEFMCQEGRSKYAIADWLESQGF